MALEHTVSAAEDGSAAGSSGTYTNRTISKKAPVARALEKWAGLPINIIEFLGSYLVVRPMNLAYRQLDGLSYKLEGTRLKTILQHTIFPVTIVLSLILGFAVVGDALLLNVFALVGIIYAIKGLVFGSLERLLPFSRNWLEGGNDTSVDIMMLMSGAFWNGASKALLAVLFVTSLVTYLEPYGHRLWPSELPGAAQVFLFILIKDFFRYWLHRAMHENAFLWRFHATHHSVKRLYWFNGIRSHPMEVIGQAFFYAFPFALLQPSAEIALVAIFMQFAIGTFQHANIDLKLGVWEYVFSIGDNHRYHHYPNKEVGDCNYGGEFIVWDILFGTFHKVPGERPDDKIGIGTAPDYPMTMAGLMIAPFLPNQKMVFASPDDDEATTSADDPILQPAE